MRNLFKVINLIPGIRRHIIVLTLLNLLAAGIAAAQPYTFKLVIDELTVKSGIHIGKPIAYTGILFALRLMLGIRLLSTLFNYFNQLQSTYIFQTILTSLRTSLFERLTTLSVEYFEKEKLGVITQRYSGSTTDVGRWAYSSLGTLLPQILSVVVILTILFITDVWVGLLTVVAIIMFFSAQIPTLRKTRPILKESQRQAEIASAYFNETVSHIATVRSFGGEQSALERQNEALKQRKDLIMAREKALQLSIGFRGMVYTLMIVFGIGIIVEGVLQGRHTPGDVLLVALYLQQVQGSLWPIGRIIIDTSEADASAERLVMMLENETTVMDAPDATELVQLESIEFKNVSFAYPKKKRKALQNVSFSIYPGQTLALVGPSGTGKTTITKLMLRFYNPTSGQILINGRPVEQFTQDSIRRHIGVVMQDVALFNDSIEANLQMANPKAKRSALRQAATQAHADIFIDKLADKYKTVVGERGVKLSGGEKQRIAIARAILKNPEMIILDEATSALDSESERLVQEGLSDLMEGRTAVVIAHRLSTVMRADQIVVLREGRVVERGTHADLAQRRGGLYARLFKLQTEGLLKR